MGGEKKNGGELTCWTPYQQNATAINGSFAGLLTGNQLVAVVHFYLDDGTSCLVDNPTDEIVLLSIDSSSLTSGRHHTPKTLNWELIVKFKDDN